MKITNETDLINFLAGGFSRSPFQQNCIHESDAEIIEFDGRYLAVTTDSISEEISAGLYKSPFLIGWMSVMINMSDLAAVGAEPIGILVSEIIPSNISTEFMKELQKGIQSAAAKCNSYVLGGDTNTGENLILTGTAIGKCNKDWMNRKGCKPGDLLFTTGMLGAGNAFAVRELLLKSKKKIIYKPAAKLAEACIIRKYASSCMDTSDGVISTLAQLMNINQTGFRLHADWEKFVDQSSKNLFKEAEIPEWFLLAGQHGEFELLFTIPPSIENKFLADANLNNWEPIKLGEVITQRELIIPLYNSNKIVDAEYLKNLPLCTEGNIQKYFTELLAYDKLIKATNF